MLSAAGPVAAGLAGQIADGLMVDSPEEELIDRFHDDGDETDRPVYGKLMVCWDPDVDAARRTALEWWPVGGVGTAGADLRLTSDFASVSANLDEDAALSGMVVTDRLEDIQQAIDRFGDAGVSHLSVHQVGPRQTDFLQFASQLTDGDRDGGPQDRPRYTSQQRSDPPEDQPAPGPAVTPQARADQPS